ncbi:MAG: ABC transporter ATP-binding protein [Deltaproteobacteria bacterium]|nr:ABC transporter ATP-binding protein [Deltaproteobacteria bacterium]
MKAIEISGLGKTYKGRKGTRIQALKGLSLDIMQGEVFGFLGPNGAGKSTTIKALMGLIRPTAGDALILGERITSCTARRNVGYLPENPSFYDYLTAEEYLTFVAKSFDVKGNLLEQRVAESLKLMELWEARKRPIRSYSKGMVQRVGLAQVLVHAPEVFILDEPMSGLDPLGRALVKEIILDLKKRGKCVFFSTHITDDVEKVCDRVGVIVSGQLQALDSVENILRSGLEGYCVQIRSGVKRLDVFDGFEVLRTHDPFVEYMVPAARFNEFMALVGHHSAEVMFVETRRKDLEAFFLEIVEKGEA